ncbi:DUF1761 domain-containing protein [Aliiroseovarius sp. F20344]|uniref:DUF1761 domain-containing protein n=1 Tax=Aliiroseovarius sp. F20344 TaxID=2926414 RepID=UPI001FF2D8D4|nr:DUF1761 domain-containing protein [Aliiroseovarius sp. F20344]MCK0141404.1 DUF1761 domain-containing protein [Aliiroseovarius sp. F20344]
MLEVIVAAIAGYAFGAVWYMTLSKPWVEAAGIQVDENGKPNNSSDPKPYVVAFIGALVVAGMMRHIFAMAGIDGVGKALVTGLGLGLFVVLPWMINNIMFSDRSKSLIWLDGGYAVGGCTVIGLVLGVM